MDGVRGRGEGDEQVGSPLPGPFRSAAGARKLLTPFTLTAALETNVPSAHPGGNKAQK